MVAIVRVSSWIRTFSVASKPPGEGHRSSAAPGQDAAGELVDDEDLAVLGHEVVHVAPVQREWARRHWFRMWERLEVHRIVQVADPHQLLRWCVHAIVPVMRDRVRPSSSTT